MRLIRVLLAVLLAGALTAGVSSSASAERVPPEVKRIAKKMRCGDAIQYSWILGGGRNAGVECLVDGKPGSRQTFWVLRYKNIDRAVSYWREQSTLLGEEPGRRGCFARRGNVLILPMGEGTDTPTLVLTKKWCKFAARKTKGRAIYGYKD